MGTLFKLMVAFPAILFCGLLTKADNHKRALDRDNAEDYRLVARALAQQTPCLILDEPTNHLDIKFQLQLMDLVCGLNRTVITAVHDLNIAAMYCDRLYALKDGKIVGQGTPQELLTPAFIREVYEVDAEVYRDKRGILRILYCPDGLKAEESR